MAGVVESIHVAPRKAELPHAVDRVATVAGQGLQGDRYFSAQGTFSDNGGERDITLIAAEAIEAMERDSGISIEPGEARRNVVVRGVDVNALVGRRFRVGAIECYGHELAHPCRHLERLTKPGVLKGLTGHGGLRAGIVAGGEIAVGDPVEPLD
jgi:MOSC domain-containing protein YiiM